MMHYVYMFVIYSFYSSQNIFMFVIPISQENKDKHHPLPSQNNNKKVWRDLDHPY